MVTGIYLEFEPFICCLHKSMFTGYIIFFIKSLHAQSTFSPWIVPTFHYTLSISLSMLLIARESESMLPGKSVLLRLKPEALLMESYEAAKLMVGG